MTTKKGIVILKEGFGLNNVFKCGYARVATWSYCHNW